MNIKEVKINKMKLINKLVAPIIIFIILIILGANVYHKVEGWSMLDSYYFTIITVTTIGYGDLTPSTVVGKIFTMFYPFLGIATAFYFVSIIGKYMFTENLKERLREIGRFKEGSVRMKKLR